MNISFISKVTFVLLILGIAPAFAGDYGGPEYSKYVHLEHDKNYKEALEFLILRADAGDGWAQAYLSDWYNDVLTRPEAVPAEARKVIEDRITNGVASGNADAQYLLAMKYLKGDKADQHLAEAVALLDKAADQGHQGAMYVIGQMSKKALAAKGITSKHAGKFLRE